MALSLIRRAGAAPPRANVLYHLRQRRGIYSSVTVKEKQIIEVDQDLPHESSRSWVHSGRGFYDIAEEGNINIVTEKFVEVNV